MNIIEFAGLLRSAEEMQNVIISRKDVRCKVISLQKHPISNTTKENMAKAGIGFAHLKDVFSVLVSSSILAYYLPRKKKSRSVSIFNKLENNLKAETDNTTLCFNNKTT